MVLFHAEVPGFGGGFVGVDVFFVISGFLITGLLWREVSGTGTVRLRAFYGARARRLLPASVVVAVATMIASVALLPPLQSPAVLVDGIASALYVSNYRFMQESVNYFDADNFLSPSPFLHYWSLGVEEQFYLVWAPLILGTAWLIRLVHKRSRAARRPTPTPRPYLVALAMVAIASFALSYIATSVVPASAFYSLPTRAWQLAIGGLVALTVVQWRCLPQLVAGFAGWFGMAMILVSCVCFSSATPFPGTAALLPTLGSALVIGAGCRAPIQGCGRLLGLPQLRAVGRVSYSWYLWHWPVLVLAPLVLGHPLGLAARVTVALLSAGLAWLTLRFVENPLRYRRTIRSSPSHSLGLGAVATAIAVCVGIALLHVVPASAGRGAPAKPMILTAQTIPPGSSVEIYDTAIGHVFAQAEAAIGSSADLTSVPSNLDPALPNAEQEERSVYFGGCMREFLEIGQPECVMGDAESPTRATLVGDSHAAMWIPAFRRIVEQRHWRGEVMAKAGCPLLDLAVTNPVLMREYTECDQWREEVMSRLRAWPTQLVILGLWRGYGSASWRSNLSPYDGAWLKSLTRMVRQLRATGAHVLVLGPIPNPEEMVPVCLSAHLDDASECSQSRATAVDEYGISAEAEATTAGGGHYADLTTLFCTKERCPVIVGNTLVYFDWSHLTLEYSGLLAPAIGALADRALAH
ncbi:acyltransferase [Mycolicibacterium parafortuitum]|uniref:acyltransferase family protein n=1 Tax=Mycolicibacterium parafortuitum TaxID=39692 RepID=UPI0032C47B14